MKNRILKVILLLSIILVIIATVVSCCMPLENLVRAVNGEGAVSETDDVEGDDLNGGNNGQMENISPLAIMEIYQQNSNGYYIEAGNPVYLTGESSSDADGDMLEYRWEIGDGRPLNGRDQEHTFEELGKYTITLTVSDGKDQSQVKRQVEIIEAGQNIIIATEHSLTVEIQYVFENTGPGEAEDLFCLIEVPQTQHPYQVVIDRRSNYQEGDRSFNDGFNIIARFNLGGLAPGESKTAYINCDVFLYEYDFDDPDGTSSYKFGDSDLSDYTKDEYFIDSDSNIIKSAAQSAAGQEKDPLAVAGRLYDFVAATLDYDYDIIKNGQFGFNYASEVLQNGKGVCTDYSVLYAALCRASGIPANIVQGIPVFSILNEPEKELSYGHAWVEIKLPGYGWIPVDVTSEENFMGYNYFLNLQTYKGSGIFHKSLKIEDENYYPTGFYYTWTGDSEPQIVQKVSYKVKGLDSSELSVIRESSFLDSINAVLSEYDAAINHINNAHGQGWTFNDPEDIAIEESFLQKLIKLSEDLENTAGAGSFSSAHNNLVKISKDIISEKNGQINCMKSGDYNCYKIKNIEFSDSFNELFGYFNEMVDSYNEKY